MPPATKIPSSPTYTCTNMPSTQRTSHTAPRATTILCALPASFSKKPCSAASVVTDFCQLA